MEPLGSSVTYPSPYTQPPAVVLPEPQTRAPIWVADPSTSGASVRVTTPASQREVQLAVVTGTISTAGCGSADELRIELELRPLPAEPADVELVAVFVRACGTVPRTSASDGIEESHGDVDAEIEIVLGNRGRELEVRPILGPELPTHVFREVDRDRLSVVIGDDRVLLDVDQWLVVGSPQLWLEARPL